jgi:hypothetical protein
MALDIFGNTLYTGDVVVFAEEGWGGEPSLAVFKVEEVVDTNVVSARAMNDYAIGELFYLQDTDKRCSLIRNVFKTAALNRSTTIN